MHFVVYVINTFLCETIMIRTLTVKVNYWNVFYRLQFYPLQCLLWLEPRYCRKSTYHTYSLSHALSAYTPGPVFFILLSAENLWLDKWKQFVNDSRSRMGGIMFTVPSTSSNGSTSNPFPTLSLLAVLDPVFIQILCDLILNLTHIYLISLLLLVNAPFHL